MWSDAIETRSGILFRPLSPNAQDIRIEDIAHALSNQCRFSGHTRVPYSVAEHSVRVSWLLQDWGYDKAIQFWGLMHDAAEAYLVDLPTPLKMDPRLAFYKEAEANLMRVICARFGMCASEPSAVRRADGVLLATEVRDMMHGEKTHWAKLQRVPLVDYRIDPLGQIQARELFLSRFEEVYS